MEKMLMTLALDERDFIKKKIAEELSRAEFYTVCRKKDPKTVSGIDKQTFIDNSKSLIQSIQDKVARLNRIEAAITRSNAETKIKIDGREMSVAEAIALRNSLESNKHAITALYNVLKQQRARISEEYERHTNKVKDSREDLIKNILGNNSDKSISADTLTESIEKSTDPLVPQLLGPFTTLSENGEFTIDDEAEKKLFESLDKSELVKDILTAIKISNATTEIEF